jgi:hypothetical protein
VKYKGEDILELREQYETRGEKIHMQGKKHCKTGCAGPIPLPKMLSTS